MLTTLLFALAIVPAGETFKCTPVRVWDGDGPIWWPEGPKVRLSGIAARELDGTCRSGHPCPTTDPKASRDALAHLLGQPIGMSDEGHVLVKGPTMLCLSEGGAGGNRTAAFCVSPQSGDISCAMVKGRWAAKWPRYWKDHKRKRRGALR